jgi:hypothetical protein
MIVMHEFSRIPTIRARTRTSRQMIRSLLALSEQGRGVNRPAAKLLQIWPNRSNEFKSGE